MNIELKRVEGEEDVDTLCQVAAKAWHRAYDQLLPEGQVDYMVEKLQSPPAVKGQMARENYQYYLVLGDGKLGGLVGFAPRYQGREEMFLSKLYLLPELQGTGAARLAWELVEGEARRQKLPRVRLTVNKGNTHAAEVYRHWGFQVVESAATDIGGGYVMDDYIMVKEL